MLLFRQPVRQHLFAFGALAGIALPIQILGAVAGFAAARSITHVDWTRAPLETTSQSVIYLTLTLGGAIVATWPALYLWLRFLRGRIDPDVVYQWITAGPQLPGLSQVAKRAFKAVYGDAR